MSKQHVALLSQLCEQTSAVSADDRCMSRSRKPQQPRPDQGFTLVEILIVIVVLGVLATVVVFAARGVSDRGESASCRTDRRIIEEAADFFMVQNSVDTVPSTGPADADRYERTLVSAGYLRDVSAYHDLGADGAVTTSGVPCP